jgi:probable rRNA maturation factor
VPVVSEVLVGGRVLPLPERVVRRLVEGVLAGERADAEVSVTFVGPRVMRRLNAAHRGHDALTDVLAFPLPQPDGRLAGDVYVCRAAARRHARRLGVPEREELARLVVHGTLHVLGWDHPETEDRNRSPMWRRQERYVDRLA